jgi:DNA-binding MarR family transcriptional regulator
MTAGELAEANGLTTGAVTRLLDRLERAGYARRVRDTGDRRCVLVELTELANRRAAELYGPIGEAGQTTLDRYTADQLALVVRLPPPWPRALRRARRPHQGPGAGLSHA